MRGGNGSGPMNGGCKLCWASGSGPCVFGAVGSEVGIEEEEGKGERDDVTCCG